MTDKDKDNWFDEHIIVMGNDAKLNKTVKDKIKKEMSGVCKRCNGYGWTPDGSLKGYEWCDACDKTGSEVE